MRKRVVGQSSFIERRGRRSAKKNGGGESDRNGKRAACFSKRSEARTHRDRRGLAAGGIKKAKIKARNVREVKNHIFLPELEIGGEPTREGTSPRQTEAEKGERSTKPTIGVSSCERKSRRWESQTCFGKTSGTERKSGEGKESASGREPQKRTARGINGRREARRYVLRADKSGGVHKNESRNLGVSTK